MGPVPGRLAAEGAKHDLKIASDRNESELFLPKASLSSDTRANKRNHATQINSSKRPATIHPDKRHERAKSIKDTQNQHLHKRPEQSITFKDAVLQRPLVAPARGDRSKQKSISSVKSKDKRKDTKPSPPMQSEPETERKWSNRSDELSASSSDSSHKDVRSSAKQQNPKPKVDSVTTKHPNLKPTVKAKYKDTNPEAPPSETKPSSSTAPKYKPSNIPNQRAAKSSKPVPKTSKAHQKFTSSANSHPQSKDDTKRDKWSISTPNHRTIKPAKGALKYPSSSPASDSGVESHSRSRSQSRLTNTNPDEVAMFFDDLLAEQHGQL